MYYAVKYGWTVESTAETMTERYLENSQLWDPPRTNSIIMSFELMTILFLFTADCASLVSKTLIQVVNRNIRRLRRPRSYEIENARRRRLRAERRKIYHRSTLSPCPSPDNVRQAWSHVSDSYEAKLHFGGMIHDIEAYVDNSLRFDETHTKITGRNGGVKEWLKCNCPELAPKYKTIMRYKAIVKKVRQAVCLRDPFPTDAVLPSFCNSGNGNFNDNLITLIERSKVNRNSRTTAPKSSFPGLLYTRTSDSKSAEIAEELSKWRKEYNNRIPKYLDAARDAMSKIFNDCTNSQAEIIRRLDKRLQPNPE